MGGLTAAAILASLSPNYALAQQVEFTDPDIVAEYITYPSPKGNGDVRGYLVRPAAATARCRRWWSCTRTAASTPTSRTWRAGSARPATSRSRPDGLTSLGGYPGNDEKGRELQQKVDPAKLMKDFFAGYEYLDARDRTTGKVGSVGFCYGGGVCNALAVAYPELGAARCPSTAASRRPRRAAIEAPLLLHYAELDERINAGWPAYEAALKASGKTYEAYIYPGVNHGFHNDTDARATTRRRRSSPGSGRSPGSSAI